MALAAVFAASLFCSGCASNSTDKSSSVQASSPHQNAAITQQENGGALAQAKIAERTAPVALTAQQKRGEEVFRKAYCVGCHAGGNNAMMPNKPIKGNAFKDKYKDDALLEKTIRKGFPDEGMPAFEKDQITESQMKDLILYIRSFTPNK